MGKDIVNLLKSKNEDDAYEKLSTDPLALQWKDSSAYNRSLLHYAALGNKEQFLRFIFKDKEEVQILLK